MEKDFEQGIALIMEADTEYQFYEALLLHLAKKHPECTIEKLADPETFEQYYCINGPFGKRLVFLNAVGTITQIHNSISWFNSKYSNSKRKVSWIVFLCYDTDNYNADVTKFYEGDWKHLRGELSSRRVKQIVDLAASAEIEDVFLQDLHGVSKFLELERDISLEELPSGKKGSAKLKQLIIELRCQGRTKKYYHKGTRARSLIDCLDLDKIIESGVLPLHHLNCIFE